MELQDLKGIEVKKDFLENIIKNQKYNQEVILKYYNELQYEHFDFIRDDLQFTDDDLEINIKRMKVVKQINFDNKINSLENCNSSWFLDVYKNQKIKDFKKTNLCKDKFCNNCKKVKQASRMVRFIPQIENIKDDYNLSLLTLTVPNCNGTDLDDTIKKMFKSFAYLIDYLKLKKKIKGLDFSSYGYVGALRSLEVTFKADSYHPHIHAVIALSKDYKPQKNIINTYSYSYGEFKRAFSEFEILIQKIWHLLMNGQRVTLKAIESLEEGYSCTLDDVEDSSYYEVFKYMTKATDENDNVLTYDNFKTLYFALHRVRQIQGYGIFYNFKDDDSIVDEVDDLYNVIVNMLKTKEDPEEVSQTPLDLLNDNEYTIISRKRIYSHLKNL